MDLKEPSIHIDLQLAVLSCEFLYPEGKLKNANSTKDCLMLHAKWWMEKIIVGLKDWKMGTFVRVAAGNFQRSALKLQVFSCLSGWWFQICFIFIPIWGNDQF